ncbi:serine/threonine phosphatase [Thermogymnomonas acidicola]|uniref:Serine/threonine phosphatase n=1 Tax=Thermogymnomonas acidicola TaxID=399579 RepID=A0AA37F8U8_9ARCH|nr:metallophosphoesterase [Thermogymnomonas acidicola]GGM66505.1 serine/threonine phosphatase [Thermogymnomonas acidicola]
MYRYLIVRELLEDTLRRFSEREREVEVLDVDGLVAVGDTHGALDVSAFVVSRYLHRKHIVFLGDYVDRGRYQFENLLFLIELSLVSGRVHLLRGNHEDLGLNAIYGFRAVLDRMGIADLEEIFQRAYSAMPLVIKVPGQALFVHGGVPHGAPAVDGGISSYAEEILWNDPSESVHDFGPSPRGDGAYTFGVQPLRAFLQRNGCRLLVRGHEVQREGYRVMFGGLLVSVFSSRYHGGRAAVCHLNFSGAPLLQFEVLPDSIDPSDPVPQVQ